MMKLIVVVTCALLSIAGKSQAGDDPSMYELKPEDEKIINECSEETGVDIASFEGKSEEDVIKMISDRKYKCFMKCIVVKQGIMAESGKMDLEKVKEKLDIKSDDDPTLKILKKCYEEFEDKKMDPCDKIYEMQNCITNAFKTKE